MSHGVDSHIFEVVEECLESDLNDRERYWQTYHDVLNVGLNLILTKTDNKSGKSSKETKIKISNSHKGKGNPLTSEDVIKINLLKWLKERDLLTDEVNIIWSEYIKDNP
jgi:hypothetical protein